MTDTCKPPYNLILAKRIQPERQDGVFKLEIAVEAITLQGCINLLLSNFFLEICIWVS
jgi:hypothetical protein